MQWQGNKIIHKNIGKEAIVTSIFTDNVILHLENPKRFSLRSSFNEKEKLENWTHVKNTKFNSFSLY